MARKLTLINKVEAWLQLAKIPSFADNRAMPKRLRLARWVSLFIITLFLVSLGLTKTYADTLQSAHYHIDESAVGVGDISQGSSSDYQAAASVGDLAVGNSASSNYQINAGSQTSPDPALSFSITNGNVSFGSFSAGSATVTTATFSIVNYTSYGYIAQIFGTPPTNGSYTIAAMSTTGASQTGTEQFGINLVANTSPVSFGANPDNGQFGFGSVAANYSTANKYRFVSGETIAQAAKSSGATNYTISYLVNVTDFTPGGAYTANQTIVVTGTY
ncbi:MAG TPA: hypothetical protein VMR16_00510 [Candidatus Saccharimonadales bacterium]|nr:hypothetical protein [Candidatus Saccharimonadales bacterium]